MMIHGILIIGNYRRSVYRIGSGPVGVTGDDGLPYSIPEEYFPYIRWSTKNGK